MTSTVKIPEGWIETTLGELSDKIFSGGTPSTQHEEYYGGNIPWIRTQEVNFNYINETEIKITEQGLNNSSAKWIPQNTVIIAMYGNSAGRVAYSNIEATTNQACCNFVGNKNLCDNKFIFFHLMNRYNEILGMANGAAQQNLSVNVLKQLNMKIPPLPEQRAIAGVLSAFDDKIELLRAENQTLEEMGQTLFKARFGKYRIGDELPDGWKVGKLGDYCETVLGGTPSREKNEYWGGNIPWINSGKVNENRIVEASEYITEEGLSKSATKLMPKGTVLIAITGATLGQYSILCIDSCFNQSVVGIRESEKFKKEFLYYFIGATIKDLINNQTGGAQQHINKQVVDNHNMIIPTDEILEKYYEISEPIFNKITENLFQIESLSKARDQLLPKLMSGEVRVEF